MPLSVIKTPYVERVGTKAGPIGRLMLRGHRTKHWIRAFYSLRSAFSLKNASQKGAQGTSTADYWQAGKSVETIHAIESAGAVVRRCAAAIRTEPKAV